VSRRAHTPQIVAALPLDRDQLRFALESLTAWGCQAVELYRWQVAPLPGPARLTLRAGLNQAGLPVAIISSADEGGEGWSLDALQEAFELAHFFGAEGVVTTTPPRGLGVSSLDGSQAATGWLKSAVELAEGNGLPLLVENRPGTWAAASLDFRHFIGQIDSPRLRVAFNPAGFVALREHPFLRAFMSGHLKSQMQLLRIRDAAFEDGRNVHVNDGNAEIAELVSAALARSYSGFFGVGNSQSGSADIQQALEDFRRLLAELGLESIIT
jgi:sugar phosphate isomerase/epimerase